MNQSRHLTQSLLPVKEARDIARKQVAEKLVLVASRRTDMPAFYTDELVQGLKVGKFHPHPPSNPLYELAFSPGDIHSVALWSQNFASWIARRGEVEGLGYRFTYRFTILPDNKLTKPVAPPVPEQLRQLEELVRMDGPGAVAVYIDPLFEFRLLGSVTWKASYDDAAIEAIVAKAADLGIRSITTSVIDKYQSVPGRAEAVGLELRFYEDACDGTAAMAALVSPVVAIAQRHGLTVLSCCENALVKSGMVQRGACVDGARFNRLYGPGASTRPDNGQRRPHGCGCTLSVDIGRFDKHNAWSHTCGHGCVPCYYRHPLQKP